MAGSRSNLCFVINSTKADKRSFAPLAERFEGCDFLLAESEEELQDKIGSLEGIVSAFVAWGGDGTLNRLVNAMAATGSKTPVSVLPAGSGNDYARAIGVDGLECLDHLTNYESGHKESQKADIGHALYWSERDRKERYFLNIFGMGYDAKVVELRDNYTARYGQKAYRLATAMPLFMRREALSAEPSLFYLDSESYKLGSLMQLMVMNSAEAGGGIRLNPGALIDDGQLEFLALKDSNRFSTMRLLYSLMKGDGSHLKDPRTVRMRLGMSLNVVLDRKMPIHADGDFLGYSDKISVSVKRHAINLIAGYRMPPARDDVPRYSSSPKFYI